MEALWSSVFFDAPKEACVEAQPATDTARSNDNPPNRALRRAAWPKRRQWLDRIARENRLTTGAKTWLLLLASRSDDAGKPVWGNQVKMAEQIERCDRSLRRYGLEAEALGYVAIYRSKPQRGPSGRWCRRKSNSYYLRLPAQDTGRLAAPRRRERAPYCVIRTRPNPSPGRSGRVDLRPSPVDSHLADSNDRSSPLRGATTSTAPPARNVTVAAAHQNRPSEEELAVVAARVASIKARLRGGTPMVVDD
jgi:hypothetical protein